MKQENLHLQISVQKSGWSKWPDHTSRLSPGQKGFRPGDNLQVMIRSLGSFTRAVFCLSYTTIIIYFAYSVNHVLGTHTGYRIFLSYGDFALWSAGFLGSIFIFTNNLHIWRHHLGFVEIQKITVNMSYTMIAMNCIHIYIWKHDIFWKLFISNFAPWHHLKIIPKFSPKSCTQVLKIGLKR
jgi:hypothetical protein